MDVMLHHTAGGVFRVAFAFNTCTCYSCSTLAPVYSLLPLQAASVR